MIYFSSCFHRKVYLKSGLLFLPNSQAEQHKNMLSSYPALSECGGFYSSGKI